ncbi:hypothetical protein C900_04355 [Fulvivirga imtechensis AK7]|uniref:Uncharacterized protein n=1 Tax=Fulvivirga imtechensis AK7 TaxID=1237149 RepID=L8JZB7_9BACT|nr:hypothetical protein C900_04355 [Fulvivirga imtechensis AK7]
MEKEWEGIMGTAVRLGVRVALLLNARQLMSAIADKKSPLIQRSAG